MKLWTLRNMFSGEYLAEYKRSKREAETVKTTKFPSLAIRFDTSEECRVFKRTELEPVGIFSFVEQVLEIEG